MTYNPVVMGKRKLFRTFVLIGLGISLVVGCQINNGQATLTQEIILPTNTVSYTPPPGTPYTPVFPTPWWPSLPVLPTLPSDQASKIIDELFTNNSGCQLPCWWGIVPGETVWPDAWRILSQITTTHLSELDPGKFSDRRMFRLDFNVPVHYWGAGDPRGNYYQVYTVDPETLYIIGIGSYAGDENDKYTVSQILDDYGPPDEVIVGRVFSGHGSQLFMSLYLYYPSKGIIANYGALDPTHLDDNLINACFTTGAYLGLWSPGEVMSLYEASELGRIYPPSDSRFISLQEATGMTILEFYETYKGANLVCLEADPAAWSQ